MKRALSSIAIASLLSAAAHAQTVRGVVVDDGGTPVPGVVLQLLDSASRSTARALSNDRGEFRLSASRAGTYRVATLRIGFRPSTSAPVALLNGGEVTQRLVLNSVRVALEAMRVEERGVCGAFSDSGAATFALWEQIKAALTATDLTARSRAISATIVSYDRTLDPDGRGVRKQQSKVQTAYVTQPWRALSPDSLHRKGYVLLDRDGSILFYAPGLDMLLSNIFVEDHCFRLTNDRARVGIAFEPTPARRNTSDIRGTLWLDRASSELRSLEFKFANVTPEQESYGGGAMDFIRMSDGAWAVSRWNLRMPVVEQTVKSQAMGGATIRVAEIQSTGGTLALARRGNDTLWSAPRVAVSGTVRDSLSGDLLADARVSLAGTQLMGVTDSRGRFTFAGVLPGDYSLEVRTASLDSVRSVHQSPLIVTETPPVVEIRVPRARQIELALCGNARREPPGIVAGLVNVRGGVAPPQNLTIIAEWTAQSIGTTGNDAVINTQHRWLETHTDARGGFRLCGLPVNTALVVRAEDATVGASPVNVRIPEGGLFAHADLTLDSAIARTAVFSGIVVDSAQRPMIATEVSIPDLSKTVLTDEHGTFRLRDIPAGSHRVVVRRVGYGALDSPVEFGANQTVERRIVLSGVTTLDSVVTTASVFDRVMRDYEDNKKVGLGHFLTRADLEKEGERRLSDVLITTPGVHVIGGRAGEGWITSGRSAGCTPGDVICSEFIYTPSGYDIKEGAQRACYAQVYLDESLMNPGKPTELFNINSILISQIEAIEYYTDRTEAPARYSTPNSRCGVLVIHTRRSP